MHLPIFYNWEDLVSMENSDTDSNLKETLILSTSMQRSLDSIVEHGEQSLSSQATFPNQGVVQKVWAGFGRVVPTSQNGAWK
jgi:hypothetical protein